VVVVVAGWANATEVDSDIRTEHTATAATADATYDRVTGRVHRGRDRQDFMSAPECDGTCCKDCNGAGTKDQIKIP